MPPAIVRDMTKHVPSAQLIRRRCPSTTRLVISFASLLFAGCATDPVVGEWEGGNQEVTVELTIDDDLTGDGESFVQEDGGFVCRFELDVDSEGDGEYELDIEGKGECVFEARANCELDGDELVCDDVTGSGIPLVLERM